MLVGAAIHALLHTPLIGVSHRLEVTPAATAVELWNHGMESSGRFRSVTNLSRPSTPGALLPLVVTQLQVQLVLRHAACDVAMRARLRAAARWRGVVTRSSRLTLSTPRGCTQRAYLLGWSGTGPLPARRGVGGSPKAA